MRGATRNFDNHTGCFDFNPRTPCGVRRDAIMKVFGNPKSFQSTHPVRGATSVLRSTESSVFNFNPRTPCGVRPQAPEPEPGEDGISIHAPRAGCDDLVFADASELLISIHAPRAGCDRKFCREYFAGIFQSTHPVRGATSPRSSAGRQRRDFNPRTPCGVRRIV